MTRGQSANRSGENLSMNQQLGYCEVFIIFFRKRGDLYEPQGLSMLRPHVSIFSYKFLLMVFKLSPRIHIKTSISCKGYCIRLPFVSTSVLDRFIKRQITWEIKAYKDITLFRESQM